MKQRLATNINWRLVHNLFFTAVFFIMCYLLYVGNYGLVIAVAAAGVYTEAWKFNEAVKDGIEVKEIDG